MIKVLLLSDAEQLSDNIDSRIFSHITHGQVNKFESHNQINLISFDWYDIKDLDAPPSQIIVFFSKDNLFFFCEDERSLNHASKLVTTDETNGRVLHNFFIELIKDDIEFLESIEEGITETEDGLLTSAKHDCSYQIISLRRELLKLKKYYEQLNQIFEELIQNENGLLSSESLRYFRILDSRVDRLFSNVLNLRDYVTQVREAYQAQIDIEQNKLMRLFTVVTTIFLPLTLIVGWYGMNLQMPEFSWPYSYICVILLSVIVVAVCLTIFKRKKWF